MSLELNMSLQQDDDQVDLRLNNIYLVGGTSDYEDLNNLPKINNVELKGNKSLSDLGIIIPTKTSDLTNDSGFITAYQALHEYSTNEKVVGKWITGKPLYEKTINTGTLIMDNNWHSIAHNISNLGIIIDLRGIAIPNSGEFYQLGLYRPYTNTGIMLYADSNDVGYMNTYDTIEDSYMTLQYTKTTD